MLARIALSDHFLTPFVRLPNDLTKVVTMGALLKFLGFITGLSSAFESFMRSPKVFQSLQSSFWTITPGEHRFVPCNSSFEVQVSEGDMFFSVG